MASTDARSTTSPSTSPTHGRNPSIPAIAIQGDDAPNDDDNYSTRDIPDGSPLAPSLTLSTTSTQPPPTPPTGSPIGNVLKFSSNDLVSHPPSPHVYVHPVSPGFSGTVVATNTYLSAQLPGKPHGSYGASLDVPRSSSPAPSATSEGGSIFTVPPSPTISERSYQPKTSVALRENDPTARDGLSSLTMLQPEDKGGKQGHMRKASFASTLGSADGTEPDYHSGNPTLLVPASGTGGVYGRDRSHSAASGDDALSGRTSITIAAPSKTEQSDMKDEKVSGGTQCLGANNSITGGGAGSRANTGSNANLTSASAGKAKSHPEDANPDSSAPMHVEIDTTQDEELDTTPFPRTHAPFALASLVDPKNLPKLTELGGSKGVLEALGTDAKKGLRYEAPPRHSLSGEAGLGLKLMRSRTSGKDDLEMGNLKEKVKEKEKDGYIGSAAPSSPTSHGETLSMSGDDDDPDKPPSYSATMEQRQNVYGKNVLPSRKSKTLLELMWIAMKDKVLVCILDIFQIV